MVVYAELPPELWEQIGKRLVSRLDIIRFRWVCKACRSSLPSPTRFPLWVPRPPCTDPDLSVLENVPYFITEHTIYSVDVGSEGDIQRVLMQFEELGQGGKLRRYAFLPKGDEFGFPMESCTAPSLDHQLSQHSFLGKAYLLRMALPRFDSLKHRVKGKWDFQSTAMEVCKIVVISSNADGVDAVNYVPASKLSVVALLRDKTRLALLRLGGSQDPNWGWDTSFCSGSFFDIASYKGKLCAVDCWGSAFIMDYKSLKMTRIAAPLSEHPLLGGWNQLVETCGDLYLVVKRLQPEPIDGVKVYKLSLRLHRWVQVDNIGNQVFFRELSFGISVPRDFLTGSYEKLMLKCKGQRRYFGVPSFLFMHDHEDDDGCVCGDIDYCFLGLTMRHCTPQLPVQEAQTAPTLTTTSSILSEYDNSIVGRVHYLDIIRCNGNLVGRTSYPDLIRTTGHLG